MSQATVTEVIGRNPINLFCGPDCAHAWRRVSQDSRAAEAVTLAQGMIVSTTDPHITFQQPTVIMDPAIADPGPQGSEEEAAADYSDLEADWELQCADGGPPTPGWDLP